MWLIGVGVVLTFLPWERARRVVEEERVLILVSCVRGGYVAAFKEAVRYGGGLGNTLKGAGKPSKLALERQGRGVKGRCVKGRCVKGRYPVGRK